MDEKTQPVKIQDLNKTQLILLSILLSFVVSIATGIVTVTLLQQASPAVTNTINRVVQHTIEKVVPDYVPGKTQTIVVKEDDLVVDSVNKVRANIFPVYELDSTDPSFNVYSAGNGVFVAQSYSVDTTKSYYVKSGDNQILIKITNSSPNGITIFSADPTAKGVADLPKDTFGKNSDIKSGGTAVLISPTGVSKNIIQNVVAREEKDKDGNVILNWNEVLLDQTPHSSFGGSPVSDLDGNIIGFVISNSTSDGTITQVVSVDEITSLISGKPAFTTQSASSTSN